jgi:cell division protein FtsW
MKRETTVLNMCVLILACLGALMVYSVTAVSLRLDGVFVKHALYLALGILLFMVLSHMDYHVLGSKPVFRAVVVSAVALLLLVLVPGIGTKVDGARRWIRILGQGFQPSEFARFALVTLLAVKLTQNRVNITRFWAGLVPPFVVAAFFAGLVAAERDVGIPAMIMVTAFVMVYVAGARRIYLGGMAGLGVGALVAAIVLAPHRVARITAYLDPWAYRQGSGWQLIQSLSAFAQGGLWGRGAGAGEQKLGYLPAAHTDFIFATIGEEFGLIGTVLVVLVFMAFTWAALRVALNAVDLFGTLLATGMCTMISFQAAFIMSVTLGMLPTKGLPLPFVSYGGTALISFLMMAGVLVNIGAQAREHKAQRRLSVSEAPRRPAMAA